MNSAAFADNRAPCHGHGGVGRAGGYPSPADDVWLWGGTLEEIHATSIGGRVRRGDTRPQTVWTDLCMWIERLAEGDRNARMCLDKQAMSVTKFGKRLLKH